MQRLTDLSKVKQALEELQQQTPNNHGFVVVNNIYSMPGALFVVDSINGVIFPDIDDFKQWYEQQPKNIIYSTILSDSAEFAFDEAHFTNAKTYTNGSMHKATPAQVNKRKADYRAAKADYTTGVMPDLLGGYDEKEVY